MNKRYLIKLYPTGPFFFGGETTFGAGLHRNYLAHSEKLPQQTTLLGMLRYQLLAQNKLIPIVDKAEAKKLIGPNSFQITGGNDFGVIKGLSPVFVMKDTAAYRLNPADDAYFIKKQKLCHQALSPTQQTGKAYLSGRTLPFIPLLNDFDHKTYYQERFVAADGADSFLKDEVLCKTEQVGIQKSHDGQTLPNAFFKQTLLHFPSLNWSFAFYADLNDEYESKDNQKKNVTLQDAFVTLGGEQSLFKMTIQTATNDPKDSITDAYRKLFNLNTTDEGKRIELLSDTYVTGNLYEHCQLAFTDTISFRGIQTSIQDTKHYQNLPQKTERLELLKRGSVLWSDKPEATRALLNNATFQTIGYNSYYNGPLTINPSTSPNA